MMSFVLMSALRGSADIFLWRLFEFVAARCGAEVICAAAAHCGGNGVLRVNGHAAYWVFDATTRCCIAMPTVAVAAVAAHHVRTTAVAHHDVENSAP